MREADKLKGLNSESMSAFYPAGISDYHHIGLMINISIENLENRHYGVSPSMRKFGR